MKICQIEVQKLSYKQKTIYRLRKRKSILGALLFMIYINDLCNVSKIFNRVMFSGDASLFWSDKSVTTLFQKANAKLKKVSKQFKVNKFLLNVGKTKYTIFHKPSYDDNLPVRLPLLSIKFYNIQSSTDCMFLHVTYAFQSESTLYSYLNSRNSWLEAGAISEAELEPTTT